MKVAVKINANNTIVGYLYKFNEDYKETDIVVEVDTLEDIVEGKTKLVQEEITQEPITEDILQEPTTITIYTLDNTQDYDSEYLTKLAKESEQLNVNSLRLKRDNILLAFDKYKSNVYYGIEIETTLEHTEMLEYYNKLLAMNEEAINNVPSKIAYYM